MKYIYLNIYYISYIYITYIHTYIHTHIYAYMYTYILHYIYIKHEAKTLCDHMDYTVHGILQARMLEWVAFHFSRGSSQPRDQPQVSCIAGGFFIS